MNHQERERERERIIEGMRERESSRKRERRGAAPVAVSCDVFKEDARERESHSLRGDSGPPWLQGAAAAAAIVSRGARMEVMNNAALVASAQRRESRFSFSARVAPFLSNLFKCAAWKGAPLLLSLELFLGNMEQCCYQGTHAFQHSFDKYHCALARRESRI